MYIVTGGAGFIGSNLVKTLNERGIKDIIVVDDLTDGVKFKNLVDCDIYDYVDKDEFLTRIQSPSYFRNQIQVIFHQGACSTTTEWNGRYMMQTNYEYSKRVLHYSLKAKIPFIYASSAAVYGHTKVFEENPAHESPLNVYGYSKLQFDRYVRQLKVNLNSQVVGLRYFNVYGPREQHKGSMASVIWHLNNQLQASSDVKLFEGTDGYQHGEQRRDFIHVDDVVKVNLWFLEKPHLNGIFNVGTGLSRSFNDVAKAIIDYHGRGKINYIPFPSHLEGYYQSFTEANISKLRATGYNSEFKSLEQGVKDYLHLSS